VDITTRYPHVLLAQHLVASGAVTDPAWGRAFAGVDRARYVPSFLAENDTGWTACTDRERIAEDIPLVTQVDAYDRPISSSTAPSLMAAMLDALDVGPNMRILEIGTGTGYNTALLCHRLGDRNVVSVEYDEDVALLAYERLASNGYRPRLHVGDGAHTVHDGPYDRLIATCGFPTVPAAWLRQVRPGGRIVMPLTRGLYNGAIAVLDVSYDDGMVEGGFLPVFGGFMPTRTLGDLPHLPVPDLDSGERRPAKRGLSVLDCHAFAVVAALLVDVVRIPRGGPDGLAWWLHSPDGSWVCLDGGDVIQGGPQRLWDAIETAADAWSPGMDGPTLTVDPDGRHTVAWAGREWEMPGHGRTAH
jgi:protein-L-isoaspartate O-methyltransferase